MKIKLNTRLGIAALGFLAGVAHTSRAWALGCRVSYSVLGASNPHSGVYSYSGLCAPTRGIGSSQWCSCPSGTNEDLSKYLRIECGTIESVVRTTSVALPQSTTGLTVNSCEKID